MCGIVGYIGREQAAPILLEGLSRLEYRGYDSAGVAVFDNETGALAVHKAGGRLQVLHDRLRGGADLQGTAGIGHTRWATHGAPSDVNSHPQVSRSGRIAVVHNGIIENYSELRAYLTGQGIPFRSETDTEAAAQLIEYFYSGDLLAAVEKALQRIQGSYALGILCADCPDQIIAVRKDNPLILGYGDGCNFIASDVTALLGHTRQVSYMEDGELAVLTRDGIQCYNRQMQPIQPKPVAIDWEIDAAEKGGYEHFMLKEIMEQPEALRRCLSPRIRNGEAVFEGAVLNQAFLETMRRIHIVACGSSYHVGVAGKYHLERLTRRPVEVNLSSEFRYMDPIVDERTLVIVISQSGETLDTMAALREARRLGAPVLSLVNVVGSSIARESDQVLYTWAGPEIAVATTKAYTTQLALLSLLALWMARRLNTVSDEAYQAALAGFQALPEQMEAVLSRREEIRSFASQSSSRSSMFFIGRNLDYALGLEGSLKMKEISYIHAEAYASGELKHGSISLIEQDTLVVALGTYGRLFSKAVSNVVEVKARGAGVLALTTDSRKEEMARIADGVMTIPDADDLFLPILGAAPLQLFAYYTALLRGCDIDKPRNLAKSVTVE